MSCFDDLVSCLRYFPGFGSKSARRLACHLLQKDRSGARRLLAVLSDALDKVNSCSLCNVLSDSDVCAVCASSDRDKTQICVVESSSDLFSIEQTGVYKGSYFVLSGCLSPLDNVFPHDIFLQKLLLRLAEGQVRELVLATNFTTEGEATSFFIAQSAMQLGVPVSRIARGLPVGGEIEYADPVAIGQSFLDRIPVCRLSTETDSSPAEVCSDIHGG